MAEEFIRATEKWYTSYRTYAAIASLIAAVLYPIFGIEFTKVQQENIINSATVAIPAIISIVSTVLSLVSRAKSQKKAMQKRSTDNTLLEYEKTDEVEITIDRITKY